MVNLALNISGIDRQFSNIFEILPREHRAKWESVVGFGLIESNKVSFEEL